MTDQLTPEQRKRVAEAVTGNDYIVIVTCPNSGGMPLIADRDIAGDHGSIWAPHRKDDQWQWKALVTWLAKEGSNDRKDEAWGMNFIDAIASNDTDALERMALEILEAQDD